MKMHPVVHFEMPTKDKKRVKKFYESAFGWQMQQFGPEMGNYLLAGTTQTDAKTQRPTEPGAINGGFFEYKDDELNRTPHVVISVDNIEEAIKSVKDAGGDVKTEIVDIPSIGKYVTFLDSEGNVVGMLQPAAI